MISFLHEAIIGTFFLKRTERFPMHKARKSLRDIINTADVPRMAAQQAAYSKIYAFAGTEPLNGLNGIGGAGGIKPAARRKQR